MVLTAYVGALESAVVLHITKVLAVSCTSWGLYRFIAADVNAP